MNSFVDILDHIADSLDPDDIIDRLGISSRDLCEKLADEIEEKLYMFEDAFMGIDEGEE